MKSVDVACFGPVFVDHVLTGLPRLPQLGEEVFATGYRREAGGGCFNTACGLARLGASTTCFTTVGKEDGQWLMDRVRSFCVGTENVRWSNLPTGITMAASLKEDRAFLTFNGANEDLEKWLESEELWEQLREAKHVHFACPLAAAIGGKIVRALHQAGTTMSVDSGWQEEWLRDAATWELLREVDLFLPNEAEARLMTGKSDLDAMVKAFASGGLRRVAIKLGAKGAALWNGKETLRATAPAMEVVDTTGAGDAFDAGFLHAFLAGAPDEICLERGAICGSLSTRKAGALEAFPELKEVSKYHGNSAKR